MEEAEPLILRSQEGSVVTLTLNRPDRLNAIDHALANQFVAQLRDIAADTDVSVVILTGAGRAFCAGGEIEELSLGEGASAEEEAAMTRSETESVVLLHEMPQIAIAKINGPCAGAAIGLATHCDLRYAAESAVFNSAFLDVGASCDYAVSYGLSRTVGIPKATELLLSPGRFGTAQALEWGLVHGVVPDAELDDHVRAVADRISAFPRLALAHTKANIYDAHRVELPELLDREARRVTECQYGIAPDIGATRLRR